MPLDRPEPLLLVGGERRPAADGLTYPVVDPATGERIAEAPDAGPADMDAAIAAAREAFDSTQWATDPAARVEAVRGWQEALVRDEEALKSLLVAEAGLPAYLTTGRQYDDALADLAGALDVVAQDPNGAGPVGVVCVLTPWTEPARVPLLTVGPALLAGNTVVLKPAADTPWIAAELGRLAAEHLPPGVLNVVTTRDVDVAIAATTDPRVDLVSFTGSEVVGDRVRSTAALGEKRLVIETGSPGVRVVLTGDDLEAEVRHAAYDVCVHAGQRCGVATQLQVPRDSYDEAVAIAVETVAAIGLGDPADPATICGPVISKVHQGRLLRYLALAESEGGRIVTGGGTEPPGDRWARGSWVRPAVVAGLDSRSRVAREELLGPVLVVVPHDAG